MMSESWYFGIVETNDSTPETMGPRTFADHRSAEYTVSIVGGFFLRGPYDSEREAVERMAEEMGLDE